MQEHLSQTREYHLSRVPWHTFAMVSDTRLYDLLMSIKPDGLTENAWLKRADVSRNTFQTLKKGSRPRSDTVEKLVTAIDYTPAQFYDLLDGKTAADALLDDSAKSGLPFQRRDEPQDVPVMGTAQASDMEVEADGQVRFVERMDLNMSEPVEYVRRTGALAKMAKVYAIKVVGDSMSDRYEDGDPAYVDPTQTARNGDFVIVQLVKHDENGDGQLHIALLKQLVRKTSTYVELYQKKPECTFTIPLKEVHAIHRVVPWREIVFF